MDASMLFTPNRYKPIEDFYYGQSVLITGGTGFLGKVLIEKLVYSCPGLENVYVLVRDKKDIKGRERFNKILESKVFERIKKKDPESFKKIKFITGDITSQDIGMTEEDKAMILKKVSIVFHLAATVRFDEPLQEAMRVNVEGTRNMVQFSKQIKDLRAFVYMSTAFCNTDKLVVEEIVYPPPMAIEDVYKYLETHGEVNNLQDEILKGRPNTYSFTKALAESLVVELRGDMPTVIIRPSIVGAGMHEPFRGWIDSWLGSTPALDMAARGWLKCLYGKPQYALDIIPVDYVINATIVAAARCQRSKKLPVYNCCTSTANTITLQDICSLYSKQSAEIGYNELWLNAMIFTKSSIFLFFMNLLFLIFPAYMFDFMLILRRKPTKYVKRIQKFLYYLDMIQFFSSRNWFMMSTRLQDLAEDLDETDQQKFPCNPAEIVWTEYIPVYFDGVLKFLIGDQD